MSVSFRRIQRPAGPDGVVPPLTMHRSQLLFPPGAVELPWNCATNPEPKTYVNLETGLSNPWLVYLTLHPGSWLSTWERQSASWDIYIAGLQRTAYEWAYVNLNRKAPTDTQHTLYWGQRWEEKYLHCPESFRVLYQVAVATVICDIFYLCALCLLIIFLVWIYTF